MRRAYCAKHAQDALTVLMRISRTAAKRSCNFLTFSARCTDCLPLRSSAERRSVPRARPDDSDSSMRLRVYKRPAE